MKTLQKKTHIDKIVSQPKTPKETNSNIRPKRKDTQRLEGKRNTLKEIPAPFQSFLPYTP